MHNLSVVQEGGKYGDVYQDGRVTATDALYILHYTVGNLDRLECCDYADTCRDGKITATDALFILHYTVGNLNGYYEAV